MHTRRYTAFISYRHADNTQDGRRWAEWLHLGLERYVVPPDLIDTPNLRGEPIRDSLYPIFRDEDELPANADLATGIRDALERSDYLIVICSPRSAVSPWVRKEVREFKELGRSDRILAIIISGEPNADDPTKARDGIMRDEECFCEELRFGAVRQDGSIDWTARTEPTAADLRPGGTRAEGFVAAEAYRAHLTLNSSLTPDNIASRAEAYRHQLHNGLLKIIAGLLGVHLGQLIDRDAANRTALAEAEASRQRQIAERERQLAEQAQRAAEEAQRAKHATERTVRHLTKAVAAALITLLIGIWLFASKIRTDKKLEASAQACEKLVRAIENPSLETKEPIPAAIPFPNIPNPSEVSAQILESRKKQGQDDTILKDFGLKYLLPEAQAKNADIFLKQDIPANFTSLWHARSLLASSLGALKLKEALAKKEDLQQASRDEAVEWMKFSIECLNNAFDLTTDKEQKYKFREGSVRLQYRLGEVKLDQGKFDEALRHIQLAILEVDSLKPWYAGSSWENDRSVKMAYYKRGEAVLRLKAALARKVVTSQSTSLTRDVSDSLQDAAEYDLSVAKSTPLGKKYQTYLPYQRIAELLEAAGLNVLALSYYEQQLEQWSKLNALVNDIASPAFEPNYLFPLCKADTLMKIAILQAKDVSKSPRASELFQKALDMNRAIGVGSKSKLWSAKGKFDGLYYQINDLKQLLTLPHGSEAVSAAIQSILRQLTDCIKDTPGMLAEQVTSADSDQVMASILELINQIHDLRINLSQKQKPDGSSYQNEWSETQRKNRELAVALQRAITPGEVPSKNEIGALSWHALIQEDIASWGDNPIERYPAYVEAANLRNKHLQRLFVFPDRKTQDVAWARTCLAASCSYLAWFAIFKHQELGQNWLPVEDDPASILASAKTPLELGQKVLEIGLQNLDLSDELIQSNATRDWFLSVKWGVLENYVELAKQYVLSSEKRLTIEASRWRVLDAMSEAVIKNPKDHIHNSRLLTLAVGYEKTFSPQWLTLQSKTVQSNEQRHDPTADERKRTLNGISTGIKAVRAIHGNWKEVMKNDFEDGGFDPHYGRIDETKRLTWYAIHRIIRYWVQASLECMEHEEQSPSLRELADELNGDLKRLTHLHRVESDGGVGDTKSERQAWIKKELGAMLMLWQRISNLKQLALSSASQGFTFGSDELIEWEKLEAFLQTPKAP
jgi:hypothetical protein